MESISIGVDEFIQRASDEDQTVQFDLVIPQWIVQWSSDRDSSRVSNDNEQFQPQPVDVTSASVDQAVGDTRDASVVFLHISIV